MMRPGRAVLPLVVVALLLVVAPPASAVNPARINGSGSTYVGLAMQQWVADAQSSGLQINYLPTGSPQGLTQFGQGLIDFAGTEAEYSALLGPNGGGGEQQRGYQYTPDVAGAVAIIYNVEDKAGRKVDYLHLSRETVSRIFIGDITSWADPAISADNKGLQLPAQPINVVYRGGQSGTTALFYDFVQNTVPDKFAAWAARNQFPTSVRIVQLDTNPGFAPKTAALNGSDQIAQFLASTQGKWSIGYDEFGYAQTYNAQSAWVQNQSGAWVKPYAQNISAALESARLRPDLSQELAGVYASPNPDAYPISAYSYLVTQCAPDPNRPTCKGPYDNPGVTETLTRWLRYIACDGQVSMARIGYSPLPANLSQEIANSIGRLQGTPPEQLTADTCANPRFRGSLGEGASSPPDPLANVAALGAADGAAGPAGGASAAPGAADGGGAAAVASAAVTESAAGGPVAAGKAGAVQAAGGGRGATRAAAPVAYDRPVDTGGGVSGAVGLVLVAALVVIPSVAFGVTRLRPS